MAKSGSLTTNTVSYDGDTYSLSFSWSVASQSIANNTTTINYSVSLNGSSTWVYGKSLGVTIAGVWHGTDGSWTKRYRGTISSGTQVIKHSGNGAGSFSASLSGVIAYSGGANATKSGSFSLPTIARANTITSLASTLVVGDWWSIYVDKKSTSTTTALRYQIKQPNGTWTKEEDGVISSSWDSANKRYKWVITGATAKKVEGQLAGQASADVYVVAITTYNGSEIGRSGVYRTLKSGKSTISMPESTIGNTTTISVKRAYDNDSLTSIVYQRFASEGWTKIKDVGTGTSCSWELSPDLHNKIPNAKSGKWTLAVETYSDGVYLGSDNYYTATLNANSSLCAPTLSPTVVDTNTNLINNFTGDVNTLVRYESDAAITIGASAKYGATITDKWAWDYVNTLYEDGTLSDVNGGEFEFYAKDSRGFEVRQVVKKKLVSYIKPTCVIDVPNPDTQGKTTLHIEGQFFNGNFGIVDNVITVQYIIMQGDTVYQTWKQVDVPVSKDNKYSVDVLIEDLDYTKPYKIKAQAIDLINQISSNEKTIRTLPVFDWGENDFNFNVPVSIKGINIFELIYPIGSYYWSSENVNPETMFGGVWEKIEDKFIYAAGSKKVGTTGGEETHTLTIDEMPSHRHANYMSGQSGGQENYCHQAVKSVTKPVENDWRYGTGYKGGDKPHNNMPPYIVAYCWHRTA